jgi:pilus assembly protein CpaE
MTHKIEVWQYCGAPDNSFRLGKGAKIVLRCIVICPDTELAAHLESAVTATGEATVGRTLNRYPSLVELMRTVRAHAPEVVFLSFDSLAKAQETMKSLETEVEGIQVIGIHRQLDAKLLRETMRMGVRDFLTEPFEQHSILEALSTVKSLLERKPPTHESTGRVFAFLPSKAGAGTSTIALNVSAAIARHTDTRVLLSDLDLNSGMMRFMLKLQNDYSVIDALEHALRVDEHLWPQLVTSLGNMDVLHAGRVNPHLRVEGAQIRALIDFARRNYQVLCFDLSGNLERYSIEIMDASKRILLVCTPEVPSLHLAREKIAYLRNFDLDTRVSIVLNRCQKKGAAFTRQQVEELLGMPVLFAFPNDYLRVNRAVAAATCVEAGSDLGMAFASFAAELIERKNLPNAESKKKFLEFFAVPSRTTASQ